MEGGDEEEAERAVICEIGFTSFLPPFGTTSRQERCLLVIGWINEGGVGFLSLHKKWADPEYSV